MYEYRAKIRRVVDGDTVDVDIDLGFGVWLKKQRVRLYGIDTPESRTRDLDEKKFGLMAKAYLIDQLKDGAILKTRLDGKGKYGRILGEFITIKETEGGTDANGTPVEPIKYTHNVNEHMIDAHHAVKYHGRSKQEIAEGHLVNRTFFEEE